MELTASPRQNSTIEEAGAPLEQGGKLQFIAHLPVNSIHAVKFCSPFRSVCKVHLKIFKPIFKVFLYKQPLPQGLSLFLRLNGWVCLRRDAGADLDLAGAGSGGYTVSDLPEPAVFFYYFLY